MINPPVARTYDSFQMAWLDVVGILMRSQWEIRNLVVHITDPSRFDVGFNTRVREFTRSTDLLDPRHVAYTIFPHGLYVDGADAQGVFHAYNRPGGLYERLQRRKPSWGTYFRRMTQYKGHGGIVNQLGNIIEAIRNRDNVSKAAYTIVIQNPGGETVKPLGGPCLNYIAVQAEPGDQVCLGLLAVYRNHDFLERAYGNYWGLCNLLRFMAQEVGGVPGPLTCVSSHAYVPEQKTALKAFVEGLR